MLNNAVKLVVTQSITAKLALLLALLVPHLAQAAPPQPFVTYYNASYEGISAAAERSLSVDPATNTWTLVSKVELTLFGSTLTEIKERSEFLWANEQPLPQHYEFVQEGFGARNRSVEFDHINMSARFRVNEVSGILMLDGAAFDDLSGYLVLKEQLTQGASEVRFNVVDRGEIREHSYKIVNRLQLDTPLGKLRAVHLERIRSEDSARKTEIWLAPDHDYLLLKLVQTEPDGRTIKLDIREATLNAQVVRATAADASSTMPAVTPGAVPAP